MQGFTLVELLVATLLGAAVIGSVAQALVHSSRSFARAEALAELQQHAHVALRYLAADIRLAGHWGALRRAADIEGRATPAGANPLGLPLPARCDSAFTTRLTVPIELGLSVDAWGCALNGRPDSDALAVRFVGAAPESPQRGRLQLAGDTRSARLVADGSAAPTGPGASVRDLQVRGYYVAPSSTLFPGQPVLRRLTLAARTSGPLYVDEEIAPGVEYFRAAAHIDTDGDGLADERTAAGDTRLQALSAEFRPVVRTIAVDIAVVVRSDAPSWPGTGEFRAELPGGDVRLPDDGYLRLAARRTVLLRNAQWQ